MHNFICPDCGREVPLKKCEHGYMASCCNCVLYFRSEMREPPAEVENQAEESD